MLTIVTSKKRPYYNYFLISIDYFSPQKQQLCAGVTIFMPEMKSSLNGHDLLKCQHLIVIPKLKACR